MAKRKATSEAVTLDDPNLPDAVEEAVEAGAGVAGEEEFKRVSEGARIAIAKGDNGRYYWVAYSANGKPIATGADPQGHKRTNDLKKTVRALGDLLDGAPFVKIYSEEQFSEKNKPEAT